MKDITGTEMFRVEGRTLGILQWRRLLSGPSRNTLRVGRTDLRVVGDSSEISVGGDSESLLTDSVYVLSSWSWSEVGRIQVTGKLRDW